MKLEDKWASSGVWTSPTTIIYRLGLGAQQFGSPYTSVVLLSDISQGGSILLHCKYRVSCTRKCKCAKAGLSCTSLCRRDGACATTEIKNLIKFRQYNDIDYYDNIPLIVTSTMTFFDFIHKQNNSQHRLVNCPEYIHQPE